jgi:predicted RND superfamily exporter protein
MISLAADAWIRGVLHHRWLLLGLSMILSGLAAIAASQLRIDSNLRSLLPDDHPVVAELRTVERSIEGIIPLIVVIKSSDVHVRHEFIGTAAEELEHHPDLHRVERIVPHDFFRAHALYYLSDQDFEVFVEQLQAWIHFRFCSANPDVCITEPDGRAQTRLESWVEQQHRRVAERIAGFESHYEIDGVDATLMLLYPRHAYTDVDFAERLTVDIREQLAELQRTQPEFYGIEVNLVGEYAVLPAERAVLRQDVVTSAILGFLGIAVILLGAFRSLRQVTALFVPLGCGVLWSLGLTQILLGHLNAATSLISTVILGLGIDSGIHFLNHARRHRRSHAPQEAIVAAFLNLAAPLILATGTTIAAFAVLSSSDLAAFREFGIIAIVGMVCCQLSMITMFPALLLVLGLDMPPPSGRRSASRTWTVYLAARPRPTCVVLLVATIAASVGVSNLREDGFEYDGRNLQSDDVAAAVENDIEAVSRIFGHDPRASVLLADGIDEITRIWERARALRQREVESAGSSVVGRLLAVPDVMPPAEVDLEAREQRLDELAEDLELDDHDAPDELGSLLRARKLELEQLPTSILAKIRTLDGRYILAAYPNFRPPDIRRGLRFFEETSKYAPDGRVLVGEVTVYVAIFQLMRDEWPRLVIASTCFAAGFLMWQTRSLGHTLLLLLPLPLGIIWMLGLMWLLDVKLTLFNVPILAAILGIGIDGSMYVAAVRRDESTKQSLVEGIIAVMPAIVLATLTTMVGFAAFMTAGSGALRSIGQLATLGTACCTCAVLVGAPISWVVLLPGRKRRRPSAT